MLSENHYGFLKEFLPEVEVTCTFRLDIPFISEVNYNISNLRKKNRLKSMIIIIKERLTGV